MNEENIPLSLVAYERACIERALAEAGGDKRAAARLLGLSKSTMYRKLHIHGLAPPLPVRAAEPAVPDRAPLDELPKPPKYDGPF